MVSSGGEEKEVLGRENWGCKGDWKNRGRKIETE